MNMRRKADAIEMKVSEEMKTWFITGASGMIGGLLVKALLETEEYKAGAISIVVLVRDRRSFERDYSDYDMSHVFIMESDIRTFHDGELPYQGPVDYLIHCAAPTASDYMVENPVETADSIVSGTKNMLEFARHKKVKSFLYLSSMEVYGVVEDIGRTRKEEELGYLPIDSVRSCYPLGKRMAEHYCYLYYKEYGLAVKVARPAQVFGSGVKQRDRRVFMQFAKAALNRSDIVLHTSGESMGNYCDSGDAVRALFLILEKGKNGEVYNVVNEENTMRIREMAELVAERIAEGTIKVVYETEKRRQAKYAPDTALRLSGQKLRGLGWRPEKSLEDMYRDVIKDIGGWSSEANLVNS